MRRIINTHLCVIAVMFTWLPVLADAALYKCVDEKTKAVTYSGTACVSGNESKVSITENAIMDGSSAQREIARRNTTSGNQAGQASRQCGTSSTDIEEVRQAENALLVAKNAHSPDRIEVRDARNRLASARDRASNPCDPGVAQRSAATAEAANAADDARRQEARQRMLLLEANRKLDDLTQAIRR
jgi:hypothetical protein